MELLSGVESLEDVKDDLLIFIIKSNAIIFYAEAEIALIVVVLSKWDLGNGDFRVALRVAVFETISNEVLKELPHLEGVGLYGG